MSVNEKMTAIADAIRTHTGGTDKLSLDALAAAIPEVFAAGEAEAAAKCGERHYVSIFAGDGSGTASFHLPFEPDILFVTCFESANLATVNSVGMFVYDTVQSGKLAGYAAVSTGSSYQFLLFARATIGDKYSYDSESMTATVSGLKTTSADGVFPEGQTYVVTAVKYAEDNPTALFGNFALRYPETEELSDSVTDAEWDGDAL